MDIDPPGMKASSVGKLDVDIVKQLLINYKNKLVKREEFTINHFKLALDNLDQLEEEDLGRLVLWFNGSEHFTNKREKALLLVEKLKGLEDAGLQEFAMLVYVPGPKLDQSINRKLISTRPRPQIQPQRPDASGSVRVGIHIGEERRVELQTRFKNLEQMYHPEPSTRSSYEEGSSSKGIRRNLSNSNQPTSSKSHFTQNNSTNNGNPELLSENNRRHQAMLKKRNLVKDRQHHLDRRDALPPPTVPPPSQRSRIPRPEPIPTSRDTSGNLGTGRFSRPHPISDTPTARQTEPYPREPGLGSTSPAHPHLPSTASHPSQARDRIADRGVALNSHGDKESHQKKQRGDASCRLQPRFTSQDGRNRDGNHAIPSKAKLLPSNPPPADPLDPLDPLPYTGQPGTHTSTLSRRTLLLRNLELANRYRVEAATELTNQTRYEVYRREVYTYTPDPLLAYLERRFPTPQPRGTLKWYPPLWRGGPGGHLAFRKVGFSLGLKNWLVHCRFAWMRRRKLVQGQLRPFYCFFQGGRWDSLRMRKLSLRHSRFQRFLQDGLGGVQPRNTKANPKVVQAVQVKVDWSAKQGVQNLFGRLMGLDVDLQLIPNHHFQVDLVVVEEEQPKCILEFSIQSDHVKAWTLNKIRQSKLLTSNQKVHLETFFQDWDFQKLPSKFFATEAEGKLTKAFVPIFQLFQKFERQVGTMVFGLEVVCSNEDKSEVQVLGKQMFVSWESLSS